MFGVWICFEPQSAFGGNMHDSVVRVLDMYSNVPGSNPTLDMFLMISSAWVQAQTF